MCTLVTKNNQKIVVAGELIQGEKAESYIHGAMTALYQTLSFVKEMSPHDRDNQEYLFEREWRIVAAVGDAFRTPTAEEKEELVRQNAVWGQPPNTDDPDILARFESRPMVDEFAYFRGNPGQQTVSQAIEEILVPDEDMKAHVAEFITQHSSAFRADGPDVRIFPSEAALRDTK
jgi:hypothetical protein